MSLFQSATAKRKATPPRALSSGARMTAVFTYTFSDAFTAASDILELGMLPATAQIVGAQVIGEGLGAITADVGIMDGAFGDPDDTRALTADLLFDDESVNDTEAAATSLACLGIAPDDDTHRGIGVTLSGDVAAGAAKKITLVLDYVY